MMNIGMIKKRFEASVISRLEKLLIISFYVKTRGWYFIISWCHRITGIFMVGCVWFYIYSFASTKALNHHFPISFLEWVLTIPFILHAFNGGRLILYESFECRNDESMVRWVVSLSTLYMIILALIMLMGNQSVSPFIFWLVMFITALISAYGVASKIWKAVHNFFWKFQRVSGAFLIVMVPAYLLFLHLNYHMDKEINVIIRGVQNFFITAVYFILLISTLYHGAYGLWSVVSDYLSSKTLRIGLSYLFAMVSMIFAWVGVGVILSM